MTEFLNQLFILIGQPIIKPDGSIRICGDYKQTINRASDCDKYPIPRTEDLFASLGGGESFTKLDLSNAYQQLVLSLKSFSSCY